MAPVRTSAPLSDVYILSSDEPMLKFERSKELIAKARTKLPNAEFLLYTFSELQGAGSGGPNLKDIEGQMSDPGLFGSDRIIKVILKDFDELAIELFKLIAASYRPGLFIIVEMPRIASTYNKVPAKDPNELKYIASFLPGSRGEQALKEQEQASKGKKTKAKPKRASSQETRRKDACGYLKGLGASIEYFYPPEGDQLKRWILEHARIYHLSITPEALEFIATACDNNLLLIDQSLQMMQLVRQGSDNNAPLTLAEVDAYFTQDSRYTGFEFPVAILMGESLKALNILSSFCSGQNQGLSQALSFLIGRLDESLNVVYKGKAINLGRASQQERFAFFMQNNIKVPSAQNAHFKAISQMPPEMLKYLTQNLAQASRAFSHYDHEQAYLALQRMACVRYPSSYNLSNITENYC